MFWIGLVVVIALYIWMVSIITGGLKPLEYLVPISNSWDELTEQFFEVDDNEGLNQQISNYLMYTEQNRALNFQKIKAVSRATRLFMVILVAMLISMALSLYAQGIGQPGSVPIEGTPITAPVPTATT